MCEISGGRPKSNSSCRGGGGGQQKKWKRAMIILFLLSRGKILTQRPAQVGGNSTIEEEKPNIELKQQQRGDMN